VEVHSRAQGDASEAEISQGLTISRISPEIARKFLRSHTKHLRGVDKMTKIAMMTFVVRDYDEAISFFTKALQFKLIEDKPLGEVKRWVVVAPADLPGASLLLAKASSPEQEAHIGNQTGGRVFLFLETSDFWKDYRHMQAHGVKFAEDPREESYGTVAVFLDLYGGKWDLLQRKAPSPA